MDFLEFHKKQGYRVAYSLDNYFVLKRNPGETKLYHPETETATGGPILSGRYDKLSDEQANPNNK